LEKPTQEQKDLLEHLQKTKEEGWGSKDGAKRAEFLRTEIAEGRLELKFIEGGGGKTMAVLKGTGLCVGIGLLVVAAGTLLIPDPPPQGKPMRSKPG
jgi:hypothetical protein